MAPTADFTYSNTNVDNPLGYSFNASLSVAKPGRSIVQYRWNFDGTSATTNTATTTYEFPGGYGRPVTLQVVDNFGDISPITTKTVAIPVSELIYLSAYSATQTSTPPFNASISNWSLGYSLSAEPHSHPGYFPTVASRSIVMGYGWRTRLNQSTMKYEGFKADLTRSSLNYFVAVKLLVAGSNPNSHLFLSGYGVDHTLSSMKSVGRGWVEDMGATRFRPRFIPDKSQPAQTICLGTHVFEYTATGGQNPGLTASSYYLGQPISNGVCLGLGWIEGVWRNSSPFIATLTYGTDTAQETEAWLGTSRYSIWSSSHFSLRPGYLYTGYSTVEPTSYDSNYGIFPVRQRIGYGYLEGSGMSLIFIPSGAQ
jgi:hypothetical protein